MPESTKPRNKGGRPRIPRPVQLGADLRCRVSARECDAFIRLAIRRRLTVSELLRTLIRKELACAPELTT